MDKVPSQPPAKKRRTARGIYSIWQGDPETANRFIGCMMTVETDEGPVRTVQCKPVWLKQALSDISTRTSTLETTADPSPRLPNISAFGCPVMQSNAMGQGVSKMQDCNISMAMQGLHGARVCMLQ